MIPKAFFALVGAVTLNMVLVFSTVVDRENADDNIVSPVQSVEVQEPTPQAIPVISDALPEVPSLPPETPNVSSLEELEQMDPGFMDLATKLYPELNRAQASGHAPTVEYFTALEQRLTTVRQLTVAAERLSRDAKRAARSDPRLSARYLQMITQLREMASDLLVEEL